MAEGLRDWLIAAEAAWAAKASSAADGMDTTGLRAAAESLDECKVLRGQLDELESRIAEFDGRLAAIKASLDETTAAPFPPRPAPPPETEPHNSPANRGRSTVARRRLVEQIGAAGVPMTAISEAVYRTPTGSRVAMPFSIELDFGIWWLGSYAGKFDEVILLCERGDRVDAYHLSREFVRSHLPGMSRDSKGNVKFHVDRVEGQPTLRLGRGHCVDLVPFDPAGDATHLGQDAV
jgi:hypothetical protein